MNDIPNNHIPNIGKKLPETVKRKKPPTEVVAKLASLVSVMIDRGLDEVRTGRKLR